MIKESVGCTLPWQALSHASCNSALEHWNENRANYERQEMTLYIKEPEIIVRFLKYQDTHCIMATITVDIVWRIVEEKQAIFFLWCLIQEEKGSQFKMLHRPWLHRTGWGRNGNSSTFTWHRFFYSFFETGTACFWTCLFTDIEILSRPSEILPNKRISLNNIYLCVIMATMLSSYTLCLIDMS